MARNIECVRKARRVWYAKNKSKAIDRVKARKRELAKWFSDFKKTLQCKNCANTDYRCIEFHHKDGRNGDGSLTMRNVVNQGYSRQRILKEIGKCDILCANCHTILHYELTQGLFQ